MSTITITPDPRGCWCRSVRQQDLIGATIHASNLPGLTSPTGTLIRVTGHDHTTRPDGTPRCWLVIDGWQRWPIHAEPGQASLTVETSDEPATLDQRIREPIRHNGPLTLTDAADIAEQVTARYQLAGLQIPVLPGGSARVRRAFTPQIPPLPATSRSYYTRGRVRRVPATGRWAADLGWAGTTRPLGEWDTREEAETVVRDATVRAWDRLEEWLTSVVHGEWTLQRLPMEELEVQDRLTATEAASLAGVEVGTWRGYVTRGQAPAPDGRDGQDRPWWHRAEVEEWLAARPGPGNWRSTP